MRGATTACHSERLAALLFAILHMDRAARSQGTLRLGFRWRGRPRPRAGITTIVGAPP